MTGLPLLAVAAVALCATARRAEAGCLITLDGDAEVVDRVRAELGDFSSGGPCVAVWARCRRTGDQLEIDLHDELGRSALHLFRSAGGAAAFLISWSRRPLDDLGAPAPPGLVAPRPPPGPAAAPDSPAPPWHPEISLDYVAASGVATQWGTLTAAVMKSSQIWRYGTDLRAITGTLLGNLVIEAEAAFGVQTALQPRITASGELVVGDAIAARGGTDSLGPTYGTDGVRGELRAGVVWQVSDPVGLELRWGYAVLRSPLGGLARVSHVALGLRWLP